MSNFMGVDIFWIGLNRADLGCWRLTLSTSDWLKMDFSSLFPNQSNFSLFFFHIFSDRMHPAIHCPCYRVGDYQLDYFACDTEVESA